MTSDCPDGYCKKKIQAVNDALGYNDDWSTLLEETSNHEDVMKALRFCEVFKLEAKVSVEDNKFSVKIRNESMESLKTISAKTMKYGNLIDRQ